MRMTARLKDERGASAVLVAFVLVVLIGILALSIDGGLLLSKYREVRRASDAAALAAAISCRDGDGGSVATTEAGTYASDNVVDPSEPAPGVTVTFQDLQGHPVQDCITIQSGGKVTVRVSASQSLMFAPAVSRMLNPAVDESSITQPKQVVATATAVWGGAGVGQGVVPMMLSSNRLSNCDIPFGVGDGDVCAFWFNNGNKGSQTDQDLMNAEWGWIDLSQWDVGRYGPCPGNTTPQEIGETLTTPVESITMASPPPTYSCRGNGNMTSLFNPNGAIEDVIGETVVFPVNDPTQQVAANGTVCPPNSLTNCTVIKYAIVGFAELELMNVYKGNTSQAFQYCKHPSDANARCLVAVWHGFDPNGFFGGGGQNFGVTAVGLSQ
jgi:Flp pilus assembly protein TadG